MTREMDFCPVVPTAHCWEEEEKKTTLSALLKDSGWNIWTPVQNIADVKCRYTQDITVELWNGEDENPFMYGPVRNPSASISGLIS